MYKSNATKQLIYSSPGQADTTLYPNQTMVSIHKTVDDYRAAELPFCQFSIGCWNYASRTLKKKASLQLYTSLLMNKNGYQKVFSPQNIQIECGIPRRSFYDARDELIAEGFLCLHKRDGKTLFSDVYEFYENPFDNPHWEHFGSKNVATLFK